MPCFDRYKTNNKTFNRRKRVKIKPDLTRSGFTLSIKDKKINIYFYQSVPLGSLLELAYVRNIHQGLYKQYPTSEY